MPIKAGTEGQHFRPSHCLALGFFSAFSRRRLRLDADKLNGSVRGNPRDANHHSSHRQTEIRSPWRPPAARDQFRDDGGQRRAGAQANETPAQAEEAGPNHQWQIVPLLRWALEFAALNQGCSHLPHLLGENEGWTADEDATAHHKAQGWIPITSKVQEVHHLHGVRHARGTQTQGEDQTGGQGRHEHLELVGQQHAKHDEAQRPQEGTQGKLPLWGPLQLCQPGAIPCAIRLQGMSGDGDGARGHSHEGRH
mmetsp:Transcript_3414/g.7249  ORF Transcript_3414/g.7249 Transcript_3414/m.7249 type:complete len:252 (-) Transcript_3414:250-1005(-)